MTPKIRILIADDHDVVRQGILRILERQEDLEVVAEAGDGRGAVRLAGDLNPTVIVMDIAMPHLNGIEAAEQILRASPAAKVILLSMYADEEFLTRALTVGVKAHVLSVP